jgi:hypothetical protein
VSTRQQFQPQSRRPTRSPVEDLDPTLPERDFRVLLVRSVNEFRHGIDALDISTLLASEIRPVARPAAHIDDPTPHPTGPRQDDLNRPS